jgi:hypothetical protein
MRARGTAIASVIVLAFGTVGMSAAIVAAGGCTIEGTGQDDQLRGTDGPDIICGGAATTSSAALRATMFSVGTPETTRFRAGAAMTACSAGTVRTSSTQERTTTSLGAARAAISAA